jgi:ankyrin repeat protein
MVGQRSSAQYLLDRGADLNWIGHNELTPVDAASGSGAAELVESAALSRRQVDQRAALR